MNSVISRTNCGPTCAQYMDPFSVARFLKNPVTHMESMNCIPCAPSGQVWSQHSLLGITPSVCLLLKCSIKVSQTRGHLNACHQSVSKSSTNKAHRYTKPGECWGEREEAARILATEENEVSKVAEY